MRQNVRFRFVHGNVTKIFLETRAFPRLHDGNARRVAQISPDEKKTDNVSNEDTVKWFADSLAAKVDVLCLDEFQVTDVADAMIIRRLLDRLWENNVRVVCTSNRAPDELYKNGLNRNSFYHVLKA